MIVLSKYYLTSQENQIKMTEESNVVDIKSRKYFRNEAAEFVYYRTYSKYIEDKQRREHWPETVQRYIDFITEETGDKVPAKLMKQIKDYILEMKSMPSMRAFWSAGDSARKNNLSMYNCSFLEIDNIRSFGEVLFILMHGTGVGFSVERESIDKLPEVPYQNGDSYGIFRVPDSKEGWKHSVDLLFESIYQGKNIEFDYSAIRKRGERLKTFGGRASGPDPLIDFHNFTKKILFEAQGRKLTDIECHDIVCKIADIVVVGGVRRSALISLSDVGSIEMRHAKDWENLKGNPQRFMANNSAKYYEKPSMVEFLDEWSALAKSGTGERGFVNFSKLKSSRRDFDKSKYKFGVNPCGEIILRSMGLCNLSEVVLRKEDDFDSFLEKIKIAVWLGAIQSSFTHFPEMRKQWKKNCEEERLLGVSITGQMDNPGLLTEDRLDVAKGYAVKVCRKACKALGINMSVAITTGKPSGSLSQVVDSASGAHARFSPYYIRRYRISDTDPLYKVLLDSGFKLSPENGQTKANATTWVVAFPIKSPAGAVFREHMTAIEQLEHYKKIQSYWCEHNQSITVYVKDEEWLEVGNWVYKNWDSFVGVSFLPYDGGKYEQPPYEEITKEQYDQMAKELPKIKYELLTKYETEDMTEGETTLACIGGACDLK